MKTWMVWSLACALLLGAAAWIIACGGQTADDDQGSGDGEGCDDDDCRDNVPPKVLSLSFNLNFEPAEPPLSIDNTDALEFVIEYEDPDCGPNPPTGFIGAVIEGADSGWVRDWIFDGAACSSKNGDGPLRFFVDPLFFAFPEFAPYSLALGDRCAPGEPVPLDITAAYVEPQCDGNAPPELLDFQLLVDGEPLEPGVQLNCHNRVEILMEYRDDDCNLEGGEMWFRFVETGHSFGSSQLWPLLGVGCSSEQRGQPYRLEIPNCRDVGSWGETMPYELFLSDRCANSDPAMIDFQCPACTGDE